MLGTLFFRGSALLGVHTVKPSLQGTGEMRDYSGLQTSLVAGVGVAGRGGDHEWEDRWLYSSHHSR